MTAAKPLWPSCSTSFRGQRSPVIPAATVYCSQCPVYCHSSTVPFRLHKCVAGYGVLRPSGAIFIGANETLSADRGLI